MIYAPPGNLKFGGKGGFDFDITCTGIKVGDLEL
jgi:hypothetical protein